MATPFKERDSSSTCRLSIDDSASAMDESSVLSSPPRSATRNRLSLFFEEEHKEDEATSAGACPTLPFSYATGRRTARLGAGASGTPRNNRRLFAEEDDDNNDNEGPKRQLPIRVDDSDNKGSKDPARNPVVRTPFPPKRQNHRPNTLKSFLSQGSTFGMSMSMDEGDNTTSNHNNNNNGNEVGGGDGGTSNSVQSRKRSSAERRGGGAFGPDSFTNGNDGGVAADKNYNYNPNGDGAYLSPRISPNSFMTMDGRFVHSKNPFSSPMMTEDSAIGLDQPHLQDTFLPTAPPQLPDSEAFIKPTKSKFGLSVDQDNGDNDQHNNSTNNNASYVSPKQQFHSATNATTRGDDSVLPGFLPSQFVKAAAGKESIQDHTQPLPSMIPFGGFGHGSGGTNFDATLPSLPPRTHHPTATSFNNGFCNHRSSFTGSPILEHQESQASAPAASPSYNNNNHHSGGGGMDAMETDTASCGSLHKVRRLNLNDDVVSASGHAIRAHTRSAAQPVGLRVDTSGYVYNHQASSCSSSISSHDGSSYGHHNSLINKNNNHNNSHNGREKGDQFDGWGHDDISPTDVLGFPSPPTPTKAQNKQTPQPSRKNSPYGNGTYQWRTTTKARPLVPPTPVAERRRIAALAARTPHPGSLLHNNNRSNHHHNVHHAMLTTGTISGGSSNNNGLIHRSRGDSAAHSNTTLEKSRFYGDFDVISELGRGCFGTVYKVLSRLDGCMYAIKAAKRQAKGPADRDRMLKEVYALAALSDQAHTAAFHIVRYHQAWMEEDRLYIQTELCQGSLSDEVAKCGHKRLSMTRRYKLLREICLALEFLHQNGMVHLDIKPDNIFVKNDQFKLGDFGLVTKISWNYDDVEEGDSRYMSMELLTGDHADLTKSDIFSLGATIYEICLGRPLPLNGPEWQDIRSGRLQPLVSLQEEDPDLMAMIGQMMDPNAKQRPAAADLLKRRQLLSDEQKALMAERTKVVEANVALQQFQLKSPPVLPMRRGLQRANTWNGHCSLNKH